MIESVVRLADIGDTMPTVMKANILMQKAFSDLQATATSSESVQLEAQGVAQGVFQVKDACCISVCCVFVVCLCLIYFLRLLVFVVFFY